MIQTIKIPPCTHYFDPFHPSGPVLVAMPPHAAPRAPREEIAPPPPTEEPADGPGTSSRVFLTTPQVAERLGINRKTLDRWAHKYAHLPGGPTKAGKPRARRTHYRWDSSTLDEWLDNVKAREAVRPPRSRSRAAGRV